MVYSHSWPSPGISCTSPPSASCLHPSSSGRPPARPPAGLQVTWRKIQSELIAAEGWALNRLHTHCWRCIWAPSRRWRRFSSVTRYSALAASPWWQTERRCHQESREKVFSTHLIQPLTCAPHTSSLGGKTEKDRTFWITHLIKIKLWINNKLYYRPMVQIKQQRT